MSNTFYWRRLFVMLQKELLELVRSFKIIWVPLVFTILGMMQPVTSYYMPIILEKAGNMPEGTIIDIPTPSGMEVLASTLQQFGTIGVLVLVLVFMGIVSNERNSGAASLVLVKPISTSTFIASKWISMLILSWGSLLLGYGVSWYYTGILFQWVPLNLLVGSYLIYCVWLAFIMTLTLLFSTWLRSPAGAASLTLGLAVILSMLASMMPKYFSWSPGAISGYSYQVIMSFKLDTVTIGWTIAITLLLIVGTIVVTIATLNNSRAVE